MQSPMYSTVIVYEHCWNLVRPVEVTHSVFDAAHHVLTLDGSVVRGIIDHRNFPVALLDVGGAVGIADWCQCGHPFELCQWGTDIARERCTADMDWTPC